MYKIRDYEERKDKLSYIDKEIQNLNSKIKTLEYPKERELLHCIKDFKSKIKKKDIGVYCYLKDTSYTYKPIRLEYNTKTSELRLNSKEGYI